MDLSNPFVHAVHGLMRGKLTLQDAVDALVAVESRIGIRLLGVPLRLDEDDFWDAAHAQGLADVGVLHDFMNVVGFENEAEHDRIVHRYLDARQLVIMGEEMGNFVQGWLMTDQRQRIGTGTWRAWGAMVAGWASGRWPDGAGSPTWSYMDFYMRHPPALVPDFHDWTEAVISVIYAKNEQLMATQGLASLIGVSREEFIRPFWRPDAEVGRYLR